jgi:transposase
MTMKADHPPCNTVKVISSVIGLLLGIMGLYVSFQEGRIRQLETKNDSIVRMQRDLEYLSESLKEMKSDVKAILKRSPDMSFYSTQDESISSN